MITEINSFVAANANGVTTIIAFIQNNIPYIATALMMGFMAYKEIKDEKTKNVDDRRRVV